MTGPYQTPYTRSHSRRLFMNTTPFQHSPGVRVLVNHVWYRIEIFTGAAQTLTAKNVVSPCERLILSSASCSHSFLFTYQPLLPDSHFTTMGLGFLRILRIHLALLAFSTFIIVAHMMRIFIILPSKVTWLPLFLARRSRHKGHK
jgi:hypothetical protein